MTGIEMAALAGLAYFLLKGKNASAPVPTHPVSTPPVVTPGPALPTVPPAIAPKPPSAPTPVHVPVAVPASAPKPPAPSAIPWPAAHPPPAPSMVQPAIVTTATAVPQNEEAAVIARERNPNEPSYWMPVQRVTAQEANAAKELLKQWKEGAISFNGPRTFLGRRMFRAVKSGGQRLVTVWQPKPPFVADSGPSPKPAASAPSGPPTLRRGSSGPAVVDLQRRLLITADGKFGPATETAVKAFQRSRGLTADGIVGRQTWAALSASPPQSPPVVVKQTAAAPVPLAQVPVATVVVYRQGSSGPVVAEIQKRLGLTADGKYGPKTAAAVTAFQRSRGLTPDGVAGPKTLAALGI